MGVNSRPGSAVAREASGTAETPRWDESAPLDPVKGFDAPPGAASAFPFEGRDKVLEFNSAKYFANQFFQYAHKKQERRQAIFTWLDWVCWVFPIVKWIRTYNIKQYLVPDIVAGLCVGCMVVPQGMSYAQTAGLPSVYGLYGAFSPVLMYALVGSSRQLQVGPVAVTSQLIHVQLVKLFPLAGAISNPNTVTGAQIPIQEHYNHAAIQLAFLVACLYTAIGVLRLGFLTNFLSHSIIGGFISANAIIIGLGQLKSILLIPLPSPSPTTLQGLLHAYFHGAHNLVWQTTLFGMCLIIMMLTMRWIGGLKPYLIYVRAAAPLTACIIGLIVQYTMDVGNRGIPLVGHIPKGLPKSTVGWWLPIEDIGGLFPIAIIVMFVDLLESTSIARALARKNNYVLAPNQEICALGFANFIGAAFNAYSTTGSFSRSAVNNASGARTPLACIISALVVGAVLLWLTPVFANLPACVLGAIVVAAMPALFEYEQFIYLYKVNKLDCLCWFASFCGVLFISVEIGLAIALGLAVLLVVYQSAFPHITLMGRIPSTHQYRSVQQYADVVLTPGVMAFRVDASLYFANQQFFKDKAEKMRDKFSSWSTNLGVSLAYVIIDLGAMLHVDSAGCHALEDILSDFRAHNIQVIFANPSAKALRMLELAGLPDLLGREWIFVSVHDAHIFCQARLQEQGILINSMDIKHVQPSGDSF